MYSVKEEGPNRTRDFTKVSDPNSMFLGLDPNVKYRDKNPVFSSNLSFDDQCRKLLKLLNFHSYPYIAFNPN